MASQNRLPEIIAGLQAPLREALTAGAELVVRGAQARVPVETGRLRERIHAEQQADGVAVVAGDKDAFYGHIVEHGSVNMPAHPFLLPALEENREAVLALVAEAVRRGVE